MSVIYGKVDLGNPERQDFFGETRKQIERAIKLRDAEEEANRVAMENTGDVPPMSSTGLYQRDFDAAQQMANILKGKKNELIATEEGRKQYQQGLDQIDFFLRDRKQYYKTTHPILVNNTTMKRSGVSPDEWSSQGLQDGRSLEEYIAKTAELDTNRFSVGFQGGEFVLSDTDGDHAINDPSLVDLSFFDENNYLVPTEPLDPDAWYTVNRPRNDTKTFADRDQAVEWSAATILQDRSGLASRDAVRWFVNSDENTDGLTEAQVMSSLNAVDRAVNAYAENAVSKDWRAYTKKEEKGEEPKSVINKGEFKIDSEYVETGVPASPYDLSTSVQYFFPSREMIGVLTSDGDKPVKMIGVSFDGVDYVAKFADGTELNINPNPMEGDGDGFSQIEGQIDANLPEGESLRGLLQQIYDKRQSELGQ